MPSDFYAPLDHMNVLFIQTTGPASTEPVVDDLTRIMAAALNDAEPIGGMFGKHFCSCGASSSDSSLRLATNQRTNALAVHYLAHHRGEVPPNELDKVRNLGSDQAEPTPAQLKSPR